MTRRASLFSLYQGAVAAALSLAPPVAAAQNADGVYTTPLTLDYNRGRNVGVLDRPRPEYDALGVPLGGFTLLPRAELAAGYTSNVYATPADRRHDVFFDLAPSARLVSNWSRNRIELDAGAALRRFARETPRDETDWYASGDGRYDIGGSNSVEGYVESRRATEPATSPTYPTAAAEASQYRQDVARLSANYAPSRLRASLSYQFTDLRYNAPRALTGGVIDQGYRDADTNSGAARLEYAVLEDAAVYVHGSYERTDYRQDLAPGLANRDSRTWQGLAGVSFDMTALMRGAIGLGYISRGYDSALYRDVSGFSAEAKLDWFPSPITTIGLTARRTVEDAANFGTAGSGLTLGGLIDSMVALRVDHELLRNLLLNAQGSYEHDGFALADTSLDVWRLSAGARYLMNRTFGLGLTASYDSRDARGALVGPSYDELRLLLSLAAQR